MAFVSPAFAEIVVGAEAGPCGISAVEALEAVESPTILVATAVNVYEVPFTSVEMTQASGLAFGATMQVNPPGDEVIV